MDSNGWTGGLFRICEWITRLAYVNLLWVVFTLVGLVLFGIAPSTVAMFSIVRKWIMGESNITVFTTFWSVYKREFKKSNILLFSLLLIFLVLYVDWILISSMTGVLYYFLLACFLLMSIILSIVLIYIFPVYVHFEGSIFHYYKSAVLLGTSFPIRTMIMVSAVGTAILISLLFPGVAFLFLGSGISFALMYISYSIFANIKPQIN